MTEFKKILEFIESKVFSFLILQFYCIQYILYDVSGILTLPIIMITYNIKKQTCIYYNHLKRLSLKVEISCFLKMCLFVIFCSLCITKQGSELFLFYLTLPAYLTGVYLFQSSH